MYSTIDVMYIFWRKVGGEMILVGYRLLSYTQSLKNKTKPHYPQFSKNKIRNLLSTVVAHPCFASDLKTIQETRGTERQMET